MLQQASGLRGPLNKMAKCRSKKNRALTVISPALYHWAIPLYALNDVRSTKWMIYLVTSVAHLNRLVAVSWVGSGVLINSISLSVIFSMFVGLRSIMTAIMELYKTTRRLGTPSLMFHTWHWEPVVQCLGKTVYSTIGIKSVIPVLLPNLGALVRFGSWC